MLLLIIFPCLVLAEPMLYMFPTNPQLHPNGMYPNQQFLRGKVRDLPDSGIIHLNRIKPVVTVINDFTEPPTPSPSTPSPSTTRLPKLKSPSSFEKYSSEEERSPLKNIKFVKSEKVDEPKKMVQKMKPIAGPQLSVPEEEELNKLLDDLISTENLKKQHSGSFGKIGRSSNGKISPKLISFDGTAKVHQAGVTIHSRPSRTSPVSVRLTPRKVYTTKTSSQGPDFDPWERMGQ